MPIAPATLALTAILAPVLGGIIQQSIASASSTRRASTYQNRRSFRPKVKARRAKTRVNHKTHRAGSDFREVRSKNGASSFGTTLI